MKKLLLFLSVSTMGLFAEDDGWRVMTSDDPEWNRVGSEVDSRLEKLPCSGSLCKEVSQGVEGILSDKKFLKKIKKQTLDAIDGFINGALFNFINAILSEVFDRVHIDEKDANQLKADINALKVKLSTVDDIRQLQTVFGTEFSNSAAWKEVMEGVGKGFESVAKDGRFSLDKAIDFKSDIQPIIKQRLVELIDDIANQLDKEAEHTSARKEVDALTVS